MTGWTGYSVAGLRGTSGHSSNETGSASFGFVWTLMTPVMQPTTTSTNMILRTVLSAPMTHEVSGDFLWTFPPWGVEWWCENRSEGPAASIGVSTCSPRPPLWRGFFVSRVTATERTIQVKDN